MDRILGKLLHEQLYFFHLFSWIVSDFLKVQKVDSFVVHRKYTAVDLINHSSGQPPVPADFTETCL